MRFVISKVKDVYKPGMRVYAYERITRTYKQLNRFVENFIGSEYLGDDIESGTLVSNMRDCEGNIIDDSFHEDESFDMMVSCDVFEHVSDSDKAFAEAYRCLKPGGKIIMTVPILCTKQDTEVRARITPEGKLEHLLESIYHGNLMSRKGSLAFRLIWMGYN